MPPPLQALWRAARGEWAAAHVLAQAIESRDGSWIHAHLHRDEGDAENAAYWYNRAGKSMPNGAIAEERDALIRHVLNTPAA